MTDATSDTEEELFDVVDENNIVIGTEYLNVVRAVPQYQRKKIMKVPAPAEAERCRFRVSRALQVRTTAFRAD